MRYRVLNFNIFGAFRAHMPKKRTTKKSNSTAGKEMINQWKETLRDKRMQAVLGIFLVFTGIFMAGAFISFFFTWKADQSEVTGSFWSLFSNPAFQAKNVFGTLGAALGQQFVYRWFGISAFLVSFLIVLTGLRIALKENRIKLLRFIRWSFFLTLWVSTFFAFLAGNDHTLMSGGLGYSLNQWLITVMGWPGTLLLLIGTLLVFLAVRFKWTPERIREFFDKVLAGKPRSEEFLDDTETEAINQVEAEPETATLEVDFSENEEEAPVDEEPEFASLAKPIGETTEADLKVEERGDEDSVQEDGLELNVEQVVEEDSLDERELDKKLKEFGEYDPTLDLSKFKLPPIDLLVDHGSGNIKIDQDELEANKNRIVETLQNYKIDISKIKATIGPTVTLYEIIPAAGVRISKIKNLEDDIALSLSALGIRIIAPIPGRGTIGIEVPNKEPSVVGMRAVIASEKFQNAKMELPIALGKTISNETFVTDLTRMPHLLMAGATGQGKSVGLNAILASILYKKHPSQVKFVLVDPKKVELTLFNQIERHYLAKLPDTEEAIITDTTKVINTLNSLCIEMDNRYELLKNAMVRNIKEYNAKFIKRKLNPEEGHKYLPYIVLVIDEFADLIMTAGKEVETPIARLAQLARAIGIHLIIATQRPSVNVITGIIKANFPARIGFRVTSKIDSRTILDQGGADQLIGRGDLLFSTGGDLLRIQCAFIDTPEVEAITEYIGSQRAYPTAYELPEYVGEDGGSDALGIDPEDRDAMFEDAARVIVIHQQGSASLLQRKLKLGYNRAGRIIDQLEAAGIIGPFEGSKARQVLVPDEMALEQILNKGNKNEM
ncbi:MAG: DNA translocase FtsK [Bacteroidota bacterium]|nr:DNA translocase FtsK [Bacteroidota bacterium]MDX5447124.1 DNA translocase FtsK [Bacteroidota bacterium]MDX5506378.1 DNA translocase FtsK [Bacteroidota bacterium]